MSDDARIRDELRAEAVALLPGLIGADSRARVDAMLASDVADYGFKSARFVDFLTIAVHRGDGIGTIRRLSFAANLAKTNAIRLTLGRAAEQSGRIDFRARLVEVSVATPADDDGLLYEEGGDVTYYGGGYGGGYGAVSEHLFRKGNSYKIETHLPEEDLPRKIADLPADDVSMALAALHNLSQRSGGGGGGGGGGVSYGGVGVSKPWYNDPHILLSKPLMWAPATDDKIAFIGTGITLYVPHGLGAKIEKQILAEAAAIEKTL